MERFVWRLPTGEAQDHLDNAIHRKGAFRRFKDCIRYYGIEQDWYDYLDDAYYRIAREWCAANGIRYFIKVLKAQEGTINEFDGSLWGSMVEFITVGRDKEIMVTFRNGTEIQA